MYWGTMTTVSLVSIGHHTQSQEVFLWGGLSRLRMAIVEVAPPCLGFLPPWASLSHSWGGQDSSWFLRAPCQAGGSPSPWGCPHVLLWPWCCSRVQKPWSASPGPSPPPCSVSRCAYSLLVQLAASEQNTHTCLQLDFCGCCLLSPSDFCLFNVLD